MHTVLLGRLPLPLAGLVPAGLLLVKKFTIPMVILIGIDRQESIENQPAYRVDFNWVRRSI